MSFSEVSFDKTENGIIFMFRYDIIILQKSIFERTDRKMNRTVKRISAILMSLTLAFSIFSIAASAETVKTGSGHCGNYWDNCAWELDESGTLTITGSGDTRDYVYVDGVDIPEIPPWEEFDMLDSVKKVVIGENITSVGNYFLRNCKNLTEVVLPSTIDRIGEYAFESCSSLTTITLPNAVTKIQYGAFEYCNSLKTINFPNSLTTIDGYAFAYCSSLTKAELPDSVTSLGSYAFSECSAMTSFRFPSKITEIPSGLFYGCEQLSKINDIPSMVKKLGFMAFYKSAITEVNIPKSVENIEEYVFDNCRALTKIAVDANNPNYSSKDGILYNKTATKLINYPAAKTGESFTIPSNVTEIEKESFGYTKNLKTVTIGENMTEIPYSAFRQSGINTVTIPKNIKEIGGSAFDWCQNLVNVNFASDSKLETIDSYAFEDCTSLYQIRLPDGLKSIGNGAFYQCSTLLFVNIPSSVVKVGQRAFDSTAYIKRTPNINGIWYLDNWAISASKSIVDAEIANGVKGIAGRVFEYCRNMSTIKIPSSVTYIGDYAFGGAKKLTSITVDSNNPNYSSKDGVLYNKDKTTLIKYPENKSDENFVIPTGVKTIYNSSIQKTSNLKSVTIPNTVTSICIYAFYMSAIDSINLPNSIKSIDSGAFNNCENLNNISLPSSLESLGSQVFNGTAYYQDKSNWTNDTLKIDGWLIQVGNLSGFGYTIDDDVIGIASMAFFSCAAADIKSITLPKGLKYITPEALSGLYNVKDIYYPDNEAAFNANVVYDKDDYIIANAKIHFTNYIHTVEINNATLSFNVGDKPEFTATAPDNAHYRIAYESWNGNNTGWTSSDFLNNRYGDFEGSLGMPITTFEANTKYSYSIYLTCDEDYLFAEDLTVKINGKTVQLSDDKRKELGEDAWLSGIYDMTPTEGGEKQTITSVNITNATLNLKDGDEPKFTAKVADSDQSKYRIVYERWDYVDPKDPDTILEYATSDGSSLGSSIPKITKFESGKKYYYSIWIEPKNGYEFKADDAKNWLCDAKLTINGKAIDKNSVTIVSTGSMFAVRIFNVTPTSGKLYGDANSDGAINMKDVLLMRKYIAGWRVEINLDNSDVNSDGAINMKDVLLMRKHIAGWKVAPWD